MQDKKYAPINGIILYVWGYVQREPYYCIRPPETVRRITWPAAVSVDPMMHQYAAADVYSVPCYYCFMVLIKGALLAR